MKKRILTLILLAALVFVSSCNGGQEQIQSENTSSVTQCEPVKSEYFTVAFNKNESLNPIVTQSAVNLYLCGLMFDSLVTLDNSFDTENLLAESVIMNEDNTACTVKIKKGIKFSDGTEMSSLDIVATVNAVKANNKSHYYPFFENVKEVKSKEAYAVEFTLISPDPFFKSLLAFPIVKGGSAHDTAFVGSGRYILEYGDEIKLIKNKNWYGGDISTDGIRLINFNNTDTIRHELDLGNVDFMYTEGSINTLGTVAMKTVSVNNAVMLAYNNSSPSFADKEYRKAFDSILQRDQLSENEVSGVNSNIPFHPSAYFVQNLNLSVSFNTSVKDIAASQGFVLGEDGFYINDAGENYTLKLIYLESDIVRNTQIERIKEMYAQSGIKLETEGYISADDFNEAVNLKQYDLCFFEMKFLNNSDLSPLYNGPLANQLNLTYYKSFLNGEITVEEFLKLYLYEMPISVLYYRNGRALYSRNFDADIEVCPEMIFKNAERWVLYK